MSEQDAGFTKQLLLAGVAKLYSGSNRLEFGNARGINPQNALPERQVNEKDKAQLLYSGLLLSLLTNMTVVQIQPWNDMSGMK